MGAAESALQYEAGIKFAFHGDRLVVNTAIFDVSRNNVAATTMINSIEAAVFDSQKTSGAEIPLDARITGQWHLRANVAGRM